MSIYRRLMAQSRRPQRNWRVLYLMCLSLGIVVLVIPIAARPQNWNWVFRNNPPARPAEKHPPESIPEPHKLLNIDRIEDRTPGITTAEANSFDELLGSVTEIKSAGRTDVVLKDVLDHPDSYRGHSMALTGTIRRLQRCTNRLAADPDGPLFEAWLFTDESGTRPWRIIVESVPAGTLMGVRVAIPATVTGEFFKLTSYESPGGDAIAPLLVARTFEIAE